MKLFVGLWLIGFAIAAVQRADCGVVVDRAYTWCCKSSAELRKCDAFRNRPNEDGMERPFDFNCLLADDVDTEDAATSACVNLIRTGAADVIDLDSGDIFRHRDDVVVVAAEDTGAGDASYYAVAAVRRGAHPDTLSLHNITHFKTCHTGVGKTAGWNMPVGWMLRNGIDVGAIQASCAPGAASSTYGPQVPGGSSWKWCELCIGDEHGEHKCDRDWDERYYSYTGAFRCMADGAGDVAFIKQTIISDSEADDYELLCRDSPRRESPRNWEMCNLGRVPAHAVVMGKSATQNDIQEVMHRLRFAQLHINDFLTYGGKNLLWGSKTQDFIEIESDRMDPRKYLGENYLCNLKTLLDNQSDDC